jgi:hypothetical protein
MLVNNIVSLFAEAIKGDVILTAIIAVVMAFATFVFHLIN